MMSAMVQVLGLLTPFDIDVPKVRIGPLADGGYVLADRIRPSQNVVSYGISTEYRFDQDLASRGHRVYMFDHTIDGIEAGSANMYWFKEGVASKSDPRRHLYTIGEHLRRHDIRGDDLLMQMDVEGAEIDVLGETPEAILGRFEQIVVEVHELRRVTEPAFRRRLAAMLRKLNEQFTLFHVHDNNFEGGSTPYIVAGLPWVSVMELSYIRTNLVQRCQSETVYPTVHDWPNNPRVQDKQLWFFPFLPSRVSPDCYEQNAARLAERLPEQALDDEGIDDAFETNGCIDVAVGKHASQSSISMFSTAPDEAMAAVTGEISGTFSFHTDCEEGPWWQVDLGAEHPIYGVVIYNRNDGCAVRAYHFVLYLAGETGGFRRVYERKGRPFGNKENPARVFLGGQPARRVRIQLEGRDYLHLDAVEVYVRNESVHADQRGTPSEAP